MSDIFRGARRIFSQWKPMRVPDAPARAFRDLWPGDPERAAVLLRGELEVDGTRRPLAGWGTEAGPPPWRAALHGFSWLRDLAMLGVEEGTVRARDLAEDWLRRGAREPVATAPEVAAARVCAVLGHWDFLAATAEDGFRRALMQRLAADGRALAAALPAEPAHRGALLVLKGTVAAAAAMEEENWILRALRFLPGELERQFHPDGGHVERSPALQMLALQDLIEIRNILHGCGISAPMQLATALERAAHALRLFRHGDGGLALFNGTREVPAAAVDGVLTRGGARGRAPMGLEETGFHRLASGRTLVIADCGAPPPPRPADPATGLSRGADRQAHAGTLSFEMSVGRDRLVVNCGALPMGDPGWRDALRGTAAHSTLALADTSSAEPRPEGLGRRPERVEVERHEASGAQWLEASHDGYRRTHGVVHRRQIYLGGTGDDLRGEDVLEPLPGPGTSWVVRFHFHPDVEAELVAEGDEPPHILLRAAGGSLWRLAVDGARLSLEESVHMAGPRRPARQAVLEAAGDRSVRWALTRASPSAPAEGAAKP